MVALQVRISVIFLLSSISLSAHLTTGPSSDHLIDDNIDPYTRSLYKEVKNRSLCSPGIGSAGRWLKDLCCSHDDGFLRGMYLLASMIYTALVLCDKHIHLLATTLYLADAVRDILRMRMEKVWESRESSTNLTALVMGNPSWFENRLRFI